MIVDEEKKSPTLNHPLSHPLDPLPPPKKRKSKKEKKEKEEEKKEKEKEKEEEKKEKEEEKKETNGIESEAKPKVKRTSSKKKKNAENMEIEIEELSNSVENTQLNPLPPPTCIICCENFNHSTRKPVTCEYCEFVACRKCCETYLLNEIDNKCMNSSCNRHWTRKFIANNFTKHFVSTQYKTHRENVLYDIEKSKLPSSQIIVEAMNTKAKIEKLKAEKYAEIDQIRKKISCLDNLIEYRYNRIIFENKPVYSEEDDGSIEPYQMRKINTQRKRFDLDHSSLNLSRSEQEEQEREQKAANRNVFIQSCTNNDCRGFLSSQWKCGICENFTCKDCNVLIGPVKDNPDHVCKQEDVDSCKLIRDETRKCPCCATPIFKISGCNVMFCTHCNTSFDWRTGKLINGPVHNPHYFEYLRQNPNSDPNNLNNSSILFEQNCANYDINHIQQSINTLFREFRRLIDPTTSTSILPHITGETYNIDLYEFLYNYIDCVVGGNNHNHALNNVLSESQENIKFRDLRVKYLMNKCTLNDFITTIQRTDKRINKQKENRNIIEMFYSTTKDILVRFLVQFKNYIALLTNNNSLVKNNYSLIKNNRNFLSCDAGFYSLLATLDELITLEKYVTDCLNEIGNTYNNKPLKLTVFERFANIFFSKNSRYKDSLMSKSLSSIAELIHNPTFPSLYSTIESSPPNLTLPVENCIMCVDRLIHHLQNIKNLE